jgi:hypothetical protein
MRIGILSLTLCLASCASGANVDPLPQAFGGTWDETPAACADQDGLTRLIVRGSTLQFYEWRGDVLSVRPNGDGSVDVDLDWASVDDTDANDQPFLRRRTGTIALSPDQSELEIAIDGEATTYVRCSGDIR